MTRIALNGRRNEPLTADQLVQRMTDTCTLHAQRNAPVTAIFLGRHDLHQMAFADIQRIFAAIPATVRFLSLQKNPLGNMTGERLALVLTAIPASISELDLFNTGLGFRNNHELVLAFAAIPDNIIKLGLAHNRLLFTTGLDTWKVFSAIPETVKSINLWANHQDFINDVYTKGHYERLLNLLPGLVDRKVQYLDQSTIVHRGIFKHLPFYFHPETNEIMYGSAFNSPHFQHNHPLLFRPLYTSVHHRELPNEIVAKIYEYLTYAEVCKLALAKTTKDSWRCVLM